MNEEQFYTKWAERLKGIPGDLVFEAEPTPEGFTVHIAFETHSQAIFGMLLSGENGSARINPLNIGSLKVDFDWTLEGALIEQEIVEVCLLSCGELGRQDCFILGFHWHKVPEQEGAWVKEGECAAHRSFADFRWDSAANRLNKERKQAQRKTKVAA